MKRLMALCTCVTLSFFSIFATHHKLIILGSGPAGLTAALYAARAQLEPLVLQGDHPGGHLVSTSYIENWPGTVKILGYDLMQALEVHVQSYGVMLVPETAINIDLICKPFIITTDQGSNYTCDSLILAMGVKPRCLMCPGESKYWGSGVAVCASCDGPLYKGKDVIVAGGGDSAMEYASYLSKIARSVTIVQMLDLLTASATMQQRVLDNPNIKIYYRSVISEINGDDHNPTHVTIMNLATQKQVQLAAQGIFVAIGNRPNTSLLKGQLALDLLGYVVTSDLVKTSVDGVFAAGDIIQPLYKQAIVAAGFGSMAALAAERYLIQNNVHRGRYIRSNLDI